MKFIYLLWTIALLQNCEKTTILPNESGDQQTYYFPGKESENWDTTSMKTLNWSIAATDDLYDYLSENGTRAFILLYKGKIVIEKYWGQNILQNGSFDKNSQWYWASAGKTLTAFLTGLAQEQGLLDIHDKTSDYLGENWTSMPIEKENLITIRHQLTMTTGLDYAVPDNSCTRPECLKYKADAGTQWFYHNAPYTLLGDVISHASQQTYNDYTDQQIKSKTGMDGRWIPNNNNVVYWSTPRSAARFGLLLLSRGQWGVQQILKDTGYVTAMTTSSQELNPSYGYLTWLNGKSSIILPGRPISFNQRLATDAPSDLFAAMGKNGQFIDVVPSKDIVVIRMGQTPENALVPVVFHNEMWKKINAVID